MNIELSTEDLLQITSALNSQISITRREFYKTSDRVSRRNSKLKLERLNLLTQRIFRAVEGSFCEGECLKSQSDKLRAS